MSNETMQVEFHEKATARFFSIYNSFEKDVSNVSRRKKEFRFQELKRHYALTMEQELQAIAREILERNKNERQVSGMDQMFHSFIKEYLHRFIQKVNDL
jgi:hypothetical protein